MIKLKVFVYHVYIWTMQTTASKKGKEGETERVNNASTLVKKKLEEYNNRRRTISQMKEEMENTGGGGGGGGGNKKEEEKEKEKEKEKVWSSWNEANANEWYEFVKQAHANTKQNTPHWNAVETSLPANAVQHTKDVQNPHLSQERLFFVQMKAWIETYGIPALQLQEQVTSLKQQLLQRFAPFFFFFFFFFFKQIK
ncbi:hypothetical protein RFI_33482 [Reticulomyxa filosa]|uniref:Uncharacterized protein n=1 Tax=Reticulomyxa filosa TaxID=46433 RepID=X6LT81_RETFI|nr:hypothetical protein RFI_33482 [Reticulomyxa filosa]|eukprot:ETO03920.1 hypothetical protein RFI_33482 [Reticulomyxa filosa]